MPQTRHPSPGQVASDRGLSPRWTSHVRWVAIPHQRIADQMDQLRPDHPSLDVRAQTAEAQLQTRHQRSDQTFQRSQSIPAQTAQAHATQQSSDSHSPRALKVRQHSNSNSKASDQTSKIRPGDHSPRPHIQAQTRHAGSDQTSSDQTSQPRPGRLRLDIQAQTEQLLTRHPSTDRP